ncbi:MAG: TolB family protein, partial [Acidimicrobiales bacterium]
MTLPDWERRFRAPSVGFPSWARHAPDRLTLASDESGTWQVYAWDRAAGTTRRVTDERIGVSRGACTPDGEGVVWFRDETGDEVGHWRVAPFAADSDTTSEGTLLAPGVDDAWSAGISLGDGLVVVGTASDDGFAVHVCVDGAGGRVLHRHPETVEVAGFSYDSKLLALHHAEHGDALPMAVKVVDPRTGDVVGEQ